MGFFDSVSRPEAPPPQPPRDPWLGPPQDVMPGAVAVELTLGTSDQVAVRLGPLFVWPEGVELTIWAVARGPQAMVDPYGATHGRPHDPSDPWPPPDLLRLGARFADGRVATSLEPFGEPGEADASRPRLSPRGGGGSPGAFRSDFWLWPLPPPGSVTLACEWPAWGLAETLTELDAAPLHAAAARAHRVWPEPRG